MKIGVVGTGRWGTFLAFYFSKIGHDVMLYGRGKSRSYIELCKQKGNTYIEDIGHVLLTDKLKYGEVGGIAAGCLERIG